MLRALTLDEIVEVTGGALVDGPRMMGASGEEEVTAVSTDTRTLPPGALFVALRGAAQDGHTYLEEAFRKGANAVLVDRALPGADLPHVVVLDTTLALGDIARYVRDSFAGPVIGITGSVGKTTTKEMIAQVLKAQFAVLKTPANHNNEIGVPQTIFDLEPHHTAMVLEMGMRGQRQILRLAEIAAPTIGVITGIGLSHIELLGSREAIAHAKGELLESLPLPSGVAVLPAADPFFDLLHSKFNGKTLTCALEGTVNTGIADILATDIARHESGWRCLVATPWGKTKLFVPSPGRFNVLNALFAVAVGGELGVPLEAIARALLRWTPPPMRLETVATDHNIVVISDAYNAAPDSVIGALETLAQSTVGTGGRRIAVLGEMRELGEFAPEAHTSVGQSVAGHAPDLLLLVGAMARQIGAGAEAAGYPDARIQYFGDTEIAAETIPALLHAGDVVLVKGSRALELERIVAAIKGLGSAKMDAPDGAA